MLLDLGDLPYEILELALPSLNLRLLVRGLQLPIALLFPCFPEAVKKYDVVDLE